MTNNSNTSSTSCIHEFIFTKLVNLSLAHRYACHPMIKVVFNFSLTHTHTSLLSPLNFPPLSQEETDNGDEVDAGEEGMDEEEGGGVKIKKEKKKPVESKLDKRLQVGVARE